MKEQSGRTTIGIQGGNAPRHDRAVRSRIRRSVHVVFEEGTQAQWVYELLRPITERVVVCDPRKIAVKGKNDRLDAERLAELLRLDALDPFSMSSVSVI